MSICSAGLPACCSAWSARSSGNASGNASSNLVVLHERISAVVRMPALLLEHLAAILPVCRHINLPGNLSARRPVLEAVHLAAHSGAHSARLSIWSSAGLFCCLQAAISSICLFHRPGANPSLHLPILAGHEPILAICLLIQLQLAASGSFSIHLQAEVSSI